MPKRFVLIVLLLMGCIHEETMQQPTSSENSVASTDELRILALGDSYTIGEGMAPSDRWPVYLADRLREKGLQVARPEIIARTGWTTGDLLTGIERAKPQGVYHIVTLQIGVNNQFRGYRQDEYRKQLVTLLELAISYAGGDASHVLVLSIPDWGVTPFAAGRDRAKIGREIDEFNKIKQQETERLGCHFIDVTPVSRKAESDLTLVAGDGLHPSSTMYAKWADLSLRSALSMKAKATAK